MSDACVSVAAIGVALAAAALAALRVTPELALFRVPPGAAFFGSPRPHGDFEPVGRELYRLDLAWHVTPYHKETLDVFAMHLGDGRWALSDGGGYDTTLQRHASAMAAALARRMGDNGTLSLLLRACPRAWRACGQCVWAGAGGRQRRGRRAALSGGDQDTRTRRAGGGHKRALPLPLAR
jgi:hypothetical protein